MDASDVADRWPDPVELPADVLAWLGLPAPPEPEPEPERKAA